VTERVFTPAHALAQAIRRRQVSSAEVVDAYLARIARHNPRLNAVVTLDEDGARRRAQEADAALERGEVWGPIHGMPITLEDLHPTSGVRSTWGGLPRLADYVPAQDGTVAARLKATGAVLLGKTHGPEVWPDSVFARTNNPWDLTRTPGGSTSGPMARSMQDLRLALRIIAGPDSIDTDVPPVTWNDPTSTGIRDLLPTEPSQEYAYALSAVSGSPMVVVPAGVDDQGLPFGVQILGKRWNDGRLLDIAESLSELTGGYRRPPGN
jgi:Asp-tRNA(Asn)/Glu-tRNA(Gln) amidotransferase A subunit family amidase